MFNDLQKTGAGFALSAFESCVKNLSNVDFLASAAAVFSSYTYRIIVVELVLTYLHLNVFIKQSHPCSLRK